MDAYTPDTDFSTSTNPTNKSTKGDIVEKHWLRDGDREASSFAEQAAADALGKRWIAPEDRDFTDRPPPGAPAAAKPKPAPTLDIIAALRKRRRAA